jgi:hypothetical protein
MWGLVLLVSAVVWVVVVVKRLPRDIHEVLSPEYPADRYVVLFYWALTVVLAVPLVTFGWHMAKPIFIYFRILEP